MRGKIAQKQQNPFKTRLFLKIPYHKNPGNL